MFYWKQTFIIEWVNKAFKENFYVLKDASAFSIKIGWWLQGTKVVVTMNYLSNGLQAFRWLLTQLRSAPNLFSSSLKDQKKFVCKEFRSI